MKTCPICQSIAFDDALQCFGCMYRFEESGGNARPETVQATVEKEEPVMRAGTSASMRMLSDEGARARREPVIYGAHVKARSSAEITAPLDPIASNGAPPAFFIRMAPAIEGEGGLSWACSVELAST